MYYSKTAALDRHVCELHRIITKVEPKAPQKNTSTENKCKMSKRELNNRIERLVLLAYTLRRKTTNEPFVPATEQEWAHLYMNGMCVKKYYTCQGRQVYVPKKIEDSTGRGCSDKSNKYNTYLMDCGGAGSGGGGRSGGGGGGGGITGLGNDTSGLSEVARLLRNLNDDIIKTINSAELKKLFHEAIENDEKTYNDITNNEKFIKDGNVILTYDNLLYIIIIISYSKNLKNDEINNIKKIKKKKELSELSEEEKQKISEIEKEIEKYNKLIQKATEYFEKLKTVNITTNVINENNKNEHEMVDNVLKIKTFKEIEENEKSKGNEISYPNRDSVKLLEKIQPNNNEFPLKNIYATITQDFFKNLDPQPPIEI